mgnify:CR=1 FL=1
MEIKRIETLSKWLVLKQMIKDKGYTLWQMQYDWTNPEGYHVGYIKGEKPGDLANVEKRMRAIDEEIEKLK